MNTIKFTDAKEFATEMHNLEVTNIFPQNIFGKNINIYHPCNLNIFISSVCHNKCFFCINDKYSGTDIFDDIYYFSLEKTLSELQGKGFEITLTGGEPTLFPDRFVKTMELCKKHGFSCRTVSTTGIGLGTVYKEIPLYQHMIENNFIHNINISRMHYDESLNKEIFKGNNISNDDIEKLSLFFKMHDAQMRISCNLIPNYIDDFNKMLYFVDFYRNLGLDSVMFRELQGCENILLSSIVNFDDRFEYLTSLDGVFYIVDVYRYKDMIVKYYKTKENIDKNIIFSFSLRNAIFADNFSGKNFLIDLREVML